METLLITILVTSTGIAYLVRATVPRSLATRITAASGVGLAISVLGLSLLLLGVAIPFPARLSVPLLTGLLVLSACSAPFGVFPLLARPES